jgi:hypothetical protein
MLTPRRICASTVAGSRQCAEIATIFFRLSRQMLHRIKIKYCTKSYIYRQRLIYNLLIPLVHALTIDFLDLLDWKEM